MWKLAYLVEIVLSARSSDGSITDTGWWAVAKQMLFQIDVVPFLNLTQFPFIFCVFKNVHLKLWALHFTGDGMAVYRPHRHKRIPYYTFALADDPCLLHSRGSGRGLIDTTNIVMSYAGDFTRDWHAGPNEYLLIVRTRHLMVDLIALGDTAIH